MIEPMNTRVLQKCTRVLQKCSQRIAPGSTVPIDSRLDTSNVIIHVDNEKAVKINISP